VYLQTLHQELDRKSDIIQSLTASIHSLEAERKSLQENVFDAEKALRNAAQDRNSISNYIETLTHSFSQVSHWHRHAIIALWQSLGITLLYDF